MRPVHQTASNFTGSGGPNEEGVVKLLRLISPSKKAAIVQDTRREVFITLLLIWSYQNVLDVYWRFLASPWNKQVSRLMRRAPATPARELYPMAGWSLPEISFVPEQGCCHRRSSHKRWAILVHPRRERCAKIIFVPSGDQAGQLLRSMLVNWTRCVPSGKIV